MVFMTFKDPPPEHWRWHEKIDDEDLFIDSACFDHVCSPEFMPEYPTVPSEEPLSGEVKTADGTPMKHLGDKFIPFIVSDQHGLDLELMVRFRVLSGVQRSLLSVARLSLSGFILEFNVDGGYIMRGRKRVWFKRVGGMFRLAATPNQKIVTPVEAEVKPNGQREQLVPLAAVPAVASTLAAAASETLEAETAKKKVEPKAPTKREQDLHALTHVPYRSACVVGRGRSDHHRSRDKTEARAGKPLIQLDYMFPYGY